MLSKPVLEAAKGTTLLQEGKAVLSLPKGLIMMVMIICKHVQNFTTSRFCNVTASSQCIACKRDLSQLRNPVLQ